MAAYRRGAKGEEVSRIQARLGELGVYRGPVDGDFGGGTESAVRAFQQARRLDVDGVVGPETWKVLFDGATIVPPAILAEPLSYRSLALTGAFETNAGPPDCFAGLSGDFDGQGVSFGVCQWNLGQGSLQPLLTSMDRQHPAVVDEVFGPHAAEFRAMLTSSPDEQLTWARSIQNQRSVISEPWRGLFKTLGRRTEFHAIEVEAAGTLYQDALALCHTYGVTSQRAVALMFDIKVQNGSIGATTRAQIERDFRALDPNQPEAEVERLRVIANRRAEAANPRWVADVRERKLTIANGVGTVHGAHYDLDAQYGIGLKPVS
jgi:putative peptidoglycan binding protein